MASELPQDLISLILQFLPVKILLRFRCVSKTFRGIIDSPGFIKSHLTKTSDYGTRLKIIIQTNVSRFSHINPVQVRVLDIDDPLPGGHYRNSKLDIPYPSRIGWNFSHNFLAHCNGLVVLEGCYDGVFNLLLSNPSIHECRKLPLLPDHKVQGRGHKGVCFGYDSFIDDYKVMIMKESDIWILGLRSGDWRRIELRGYPIIDNFRNCFVNGAFYFFRGSGGVVLAFDLAKETFSEIYLPDIRQTQHDYFSNLHVLEGCLCVGFYYRWGQPFELYARKKNEVGEFSWTRLLSITCQSAVDAYILRCSEILGFSKGGDKMYVLHRECEAYSYDFKEKSTKRISASHKHDQKVFSYIESLVSVN